MSPHLRRARLAQENIRLAQALRDGLYAEIRDANEHGVTVPDWPAVTALAAQLVVLTDPQRPYRALTENELATAPKGAA